jgi:FMN phosphatase YigB (HAD superfamily)
VARSPDLVLFDLGGVLIELRGVATMAELSGIDDEDEFWWRWLECRWVRIFESGRCSPDEFARGVVDDWELPVRPDDLLEIFASWPTGPIEGAEVLVRETAAVVPVGCLSNTNELHWEGYAEDWPLIALFGHRFVSHRMGRVKPDADTFTWVADEIEVAPDRVLFLDDNEANVAGARTAGFCAERVVGVHDARRALELHGIL